MGLIHIDLFTTLDGVAQAPGGPEEDPADDFAFGGWQAPLIDKVVGDQIDSGMEGMDALLLGRRTYDIFAAYWPHQGGEIAEAEVNGLLQLEDLVAGQEDIRDVGLDQADLPGTVGKGAGTQQGSDVWRQRVGASSLRHRQSPV